MKRILTTIAVVTLLSVAAHAEKSACNAIPWGEQFSAVEKIEFSHAAEGVRYYRVTKVDACGIGRLEGAEVTYGFHKNRLFATIVEIDKAKDLKQVLSVMMEEYGLPKHRKNASWDVYEWENEQLTVKLKSQYMTDRVKIGMYYKPLVPEETQ